MTHQDKEKKMLQSERAKQDFSSNQSRNSVDAH